MKRNRRFLIQLVLLLLMTSVGVNLAVAGYWTSASGELTGYTWIPARQYLYEQSVEYHTSKKLITGGHAEGAYRNSYSIRFQELGIGSGSVQLQISQVLPVEPANYYPDGYVVPIKVHRSNVSVEFLGGTVNPSLANSTYSAALVLPPEDGVLKVRYALKANTSDNQGMQVAAAGLVFAEPARPGQGGFTHQLANDSQKPTGEILAPFMAGDHFTLRVGGDIKGGSSYLWCGCQSASAAVAWTTQSFFPGDVPQKPIILAAGITGYDTPSDDENDLPPEAGNPDSIVGVNLTAPVTGGAGTTNTMYVGGNHASSPAAFSDGLSLGTVDNSVELQEVFITSFSMRFTGFEIPTEAGLDSEILFLKFGDHYETYSPGTYFDFTPFDPTGIGSFSVFATPDNINPDEVGLQFVHGFRFMSEGVANVWEFTITVPEPASGLLSLGVLAFGCFSRRVL